MMANKRLLRGCLFCLSVGGLLFSASSAKAKCNNTVECAQQAVEAATTAKAQYELILKQVVPPHAVIAFDLKDCPEGWKPYDKAYGKFLRGIDPTNSKNVDPSGTRPPGDPQEDALKSHQHTILVGPIEGGSTQAWAPPHIGTAAASAVTLKAGEDETRPKNVAVLFCERN